MTDTPLPERLTSLLGYLDHDPGNDTLRADAVSEALQANQAGLAHRLLSERNKTAPMPLVLVNLAGHVALARQDHATAVEHFQSLISSVPEDLNARFNAAWALAMTGRKDEALALLSEDVVSSLPQAAMLEIQLRHEQGDLEDAIVKGRTYLTKYPEHRGLAAAVSVLAMDVEDLGLAKAAALKAGDHPDAITTLSLIQLGDGALDAAVNGFDKALAASSQIPRARLGRGLARLAQRKVELALDDLDAAATQFQTHLGSWVASGWAHLLLGDLVTCRKRFESGMAVDDTFSELQGGLAVIDVLEGHTEDAARRITIAMKLDRTCFSAVLAQTLLLHNRGDIEEAKALIERALKTPINERGDTLTSEIVRLGLA